MIRLLKIEWNKLFYYRATRVFTIIYFLLLLFGGLILAYFKPEINGVEIDFAKLGFFNFPVVWENTAYLLSILKVFIGMLIIMNITNEYSNSTLKQNLIDGLGKKEFLISKILTNTVLALLSTFVLFFIALTLGMVFSQSENSFLSGVEYMGAYFLKMNLFFSICMFLAFWLRKTAFAFLGLIVLWMLEAAVFVAEKLGRSRLMGDFIEGDFYFSDYLPLNVSSNLIKFPKVNLEAAMFGGEVFSFRPVEWNYFAAAVFYILLFCFLSYWLLNKRDL